MEVGAYIGILCLFVGVLADKPGTCPLLPNTDGRLSCHDDFGCTGQMKCCSGSCAIPECEPGTKAAQCETNPCDDATCDSVPDAQCIADMCATSCEAMWYTMEGDVTHLCTGSELEEEQSAVDWGSLSKKQRTALRKQKKKRRLANKAARLEKKATKTEMKGDKKDGRKAARKQMKEERQRAKEVKKQQRKDKKATKLARKQDKVTLTTADGKRAARKQARIDARMTKKAARQEKRRQLMEVKRRRKAERQAARTARQEGRIQASNE